MCTMHGMHRMRTWEQRKMDEEWTTVLDPRSTVGSGNFGKKHEDMWYNTGPTVVDASVECRMANPVDYKGPVTSGKSATNSDGCIAKPPSVKLSIHTNDLGNVAVLTSVHH